MIDINTKILGLIGYPLTHSISPLLHNHTIRIENLNYVYLAFPVQEGNFASAVEGLKAIGVRGFNVTIPYKEKIIPFLDNIDPLAARVGAVNTVLNESRKLTGYNTDLTGFIRMLKVDAGFHINGKTIMIIGAGGAARAVGIAVLSAGAERVFLLNRTTSKAEELINEWQEYYPGIELLSGPLDSVFYGKYLNEVDLLVDTTPIGMFPEIDIEPVISSEYLHKNMLVVDLVYNPEKTSIMKAGEKAGADTLNGMGMLLYQGIEAFKIWTGFDISPESWQKIAKKNYESNKLLQNTKEI